MKKRLCLARYTENIDWVKNINPNIVVYTYHKKDTSSINYDEKICINDHNFELRNVGRESHTYLKHILDNYENLFDLEFFSQGSPFDHFNFLDVVNNDSILEYRQYSYHPVRFVSVDGNIPSHMGTPNTRDIWYDLFNYDPPEKVTITPHGLIKIDKNIILMHDKKIYTKCLEYFKDCSKDNPYAWSFEYFWPLLFHPIHRTKK